MITRTQSIAIFLVLLAVVAVPAAVAQQDTGSDSSPPEPGVSVDEEEYTRLSVGVDDGYPDLKPGESETMTVTVRNLDDDEVALAPALEHLPQRSDLLPEDWVSFDTDEQTLSPDEQVEFDVTVSVPANAELGRYHGIIAVTDERIHTPGQPARPLHAAGLGVNVYDDPTVHIVSQSHLHGQIEAGESATAEITIENTGEDAVPLNPEIGSDHRVRTVPAAEGVLDPAWVSIDAPTEIAPESRETVEVTVSPPADAELGRYRTELELGLQDPARPDGSDYWQRIGIDINVWSEPDEPYVREFDVSADTEAIELRLTQQSGYGLSAFTDDPAPGSFDVRFESPDGEYLSPDRTHLSDRGSVDLTGDRHHGTPENGYIEGSTSREHVYRIKQPTDGTWSVEIIPENTIGFSYELVRDESSD